MSLLDKVLCDHGIIDLEGAASPPERLAYDYELEVDMPLPIRLARKLEAEYEVDPVRGHLLRRPAGPRQGTRRVSYVTMHRRCWMKTNRCIVPNISEDGEWLSWVTQEKISAAKAIVCRVRGYIPGSVKFKDPAKRPGQGLYAIGNLLPSLRDPDCLQAKDALYKSVIEKYETQGPTSINLICQLYFRTRYDTLIPVEDYGELGEEVRGRDMFPEDRLVRVSVDRGWFNVGMWIVARRKQVVGLDEAGRMLYL